MLLAADERKAVYAVVPFLLSTRWCGLYYRADDNRIAITQGVLHLHTYRSAWAIGGTWITDRTAVFRGSVVEGDSRYGIVPPALPLGNERKAFFVIGDHVYLTSVPVRSSFLYHSLRLGFVSTLEISQRIGYVHFYIYDSRVVFVPASKGFSLTSVPVDLTLQSFSERSVTVTTTATSSFRFCQLGYTTWSDKKALCFTGTPFYLTSPPIHLTLSEIVTDRLVHVGRPDWSGSYRWAFYKVIDFSEMWACLRYLAASDRVGLCATRRANYIDTFLLLLARLRYSVRFGITSGFIYSTDRVAVVELRDLMISSRPLAATYEFHPYVPGSYAQFKISAHRMFEHATTASETSKFTGAASWGLYMKTETPIRFSGVLTDGAKISRTTSQSLKLRGGLWVRWGITVT